MRKRCATLAVRKVRCSDRFLWLSEGKGERSVESVETFDQKVELDYSALTEKQRLKRILIHCAFVEFCTRRRHPVLVLSEREGKRIAPHQHLSDFIAMLSLLLGNVLQEFSDVRMLESDSPKLLW
jgi:hypothetical protein